MPARLLLTTLFALFVVFPSAGFAQMAPAKPLDPITAIIDAFKTHDVVALGEGNHGNEQGSAFREKLYRDPRFQTVVNDIVVEAGNSRQQAMMDRYIAGEDVPEKELRLAWLQTTQAHTVWDKDMYRDMFRAVRDINRQLPKARQFRVLLGDPPFPPPPLAPNSGPMGFDQFTADLVRSEVIAKKRKALIVYGDLHYLRLEPQPQQTPGQPALPQRASIVARLETAGVKVFSISTFTGSVTGEGLPSLQPDIARWPVPSLALIKGTPLGAAPSAFYYARGLGAMQEQFDAVLYLGPRSRITQARLSASLCADPDYVEFRTARLKNPNALPQPPAQMDSFLAQQLDFFRADCAVLNANRTTPTPGLADLARKIIDGYAKGDPALDIMAPALAQNAQTQRNAQLQSSARSGPLVSLIFKEARNGAASGDTYIGVFAYASRFVSVSTGADGKVSSFSIGPFLPPTAEQRNASFKAIDLNGDAKLDRSEYGAMLDRAGFASRLDNIFAQLDADTDGLITTKEFETEPQ